MRSLRRGAGVLALLLGAVGTGAVAREACEVEVARAVAGDDAVSALDDPRVLAGYRRLLGDAARRAIDRIAANERYRFTGLQLGWISLRGGAKDAWEPIFGLGRGFRPSGSPSTAVRAFYEAPARSECGVGRQVAQYATLLELYGDAAFDREFGRDEIVIGTFNKLRRTDSVLLGAHAGALEGDGLAVGASAIGRDAFVGAPGFLYAANPEALSDTNNQAQNFVVHAVGDRAERGLREHGGFAHYNRALREAWALAQSIGELGHRGYERALLRRDEALLARLAPTQREALGRIDALLGDPFFTEFEIYVHPKGVKPLGYHVVRMLDRNFGTPYVVELALHNLHGTHFRRYLAHRVDACRATR